MNVHGYELLTDWRTSTSGKIALGEKGGMTYFLKKYQTPVAPIDNGALDAKTFAHNAELFEEFVKTRASVNSYIRSIAGPGGNIIIPSDEFIEGNQYVEASELVEGVVPDDELETILASLSMDVKKLLMQTAAGALASVHRLHIVHSDLKLKNVLLVRNKAGNYVAKLIDFDSSYFVDKKPDEVIGTIDYYSPELGVYSDAEDDEERAVLGKDLTEKSDIFSLGLIFHQYLTGKLPVATDLNERLQKRRDKGKVIYCWVALNQGCRIEISPEIDSPKYRALITEMLDVDPTKRPSALEVLRKLQASDPVIEEPWPEHGIVLDKAKLNEAKVAGLKKVTSGGTRSYELLFEDGRKMNATKDDLISKGLTKTVAVKGFPEPWPEHGITLDEEKLKSRGFVSGARKTMAGINGYEMYRADGTPTFLKAEMLLAMKYARKGASAPAESGSAPAAAKSEPAARPEVGSFDEPWPEHNIEFDPAMIRAKGYVSCERKTMGGVNGYSFLRADGTPQFIRIEMVLLQKLAKRK